MRTEVFRAKGKSRAKGTGHDPAEKGGKGGERSFGAQQAVASLRRRSARQDNDTSHSPSVKRS